MRVPYTWLREYCDPGVPAEELAERLVMTGTGRAWVSAKVIIRSTLPSARWASGRPTRRSRSWNP